MRPCLFTTLCASPNFGFSRALQPNYLLCRSNIFIRSPLFRYLRRTALRFCARDYQLAKWRRYIACRVASTFAFSTAPIRSLGVDRLYPRCIGRSFAYFTLDDNNPIILRAKKLDID